MATLKQLLADQEELAGWMSNFWKNTTKKGVANLTKGTLTHRKASLEEYWSSFVSRHRSIRADPESANLSYITENCFLQIEEAYHENTGKLIDAINGSSTPAIPTEFIVPQGVASRSSTIAKIQLPTFDGDWLNWPSFKGLFESLVHNDPDLPKVLKLQHLLVHLSGEAAAMLENIDINDEAYEGSWQDLIDAYENSHLLLFRCMRHTFDCPPISKASAAELKRIIAAFKRSKRAFLALKRPVEQWSDWFLFICVDKLDNATKMYWQTSQANSKEISTFDKLLEFLESRTQALTVTYSCTSESNLNSNLNPVVRSTIKDARSSVAVHTVAHSGDTKKCRALSARKDTFWDSVLNLKLSR